MSVQDTDIIMLLVRTDRDFIALKRFGYSMARLLEKYPDTCPDHVIAAALKIEESAVETEYLRIAAKLRGLMNVEP